MMSRELRAEEREEVELEPGCSREDMTRMVLWKARSRMLVRSGLWRGVF